MQAVLYTGTGATQTIAVGFQPDLVWIKSRSAATDNKLTDSVRGATKALISNSTGAETTDTNGITAFTSNGFTLGSDSVYNTNGATYVAWCWQAGQGSTSSNTNGTITSTVSVNASAGFSVVTYTGDGGNFSVGHGLGVTPRMIMVKGRSNTSDWFVYHGSMGEQNYALLNSAAAKVSNANYFRDLSSTTYGGTNSASGLNTNGVTYVAYCWTPIAGYSSFGSYLGNNSTDGPYVYLGFKPKFLLIKASSTTDDWYIYDSVRNTYNIVNLALFPDLSNAEATGIVTTIDFLSNGFKLRNTGLNGPSVTYIYMAFAENPFKNALAR
jgi:hypothetical protein